MTKRLPASLSRDETIAESNAVLEMPDITIEQEENVFSIEALDMEWDIGVTVYEPADESKIPRGVGRQEGGNLHVARGLGRL